MTTTDSRGNGGLARGLADVTDLCQECNFPYDKGKKRKLIDACGHEKCWACMVKQEECQICAKNIPLETFTVVKQEIGENIEHREETEPMNNSNHQLEQDRHTESQLNKQGDEKKVKHVRKRTKPKAIKPKASPAILIPYDILRKGVQHLNQVDSTSSDGSAIQMIPKHAMNVTNNFQIPYILPCGVAKAANGILNVVNVTQNIALDSSEKEKVTKPKCKRKKRVSKNPTAPKIDTNNELICKYCGKLCKNKSKVMEHRFIHTGTGLHQCEICKENFTTENALKEHAKTHEESNGLVCPVCKKVFYKKYYLDNHTGCDPSGKPHKCEICDIRFKEKYQLTLHMKRHTGEFDKKCSVCGKGFRTTSTLNIHMRKHTGEQTFICETCGKGFFIKGQLNVHRQTHSGERPYACEHCEQCFSTRGGLYSHKRTIHPTNPEKLYKCDTCDKAFLLQTQLNQHQKKHDGSLRCQCDVCGKDFANSTTLKNHYLIHTDSKPFHCEQCGMTFRQFVAKQTHMLIHTGAKPLSCKICNMKFRHRSTLSGHMRKHEQSMLGTE